MNKTFFYIILIAGILVSCQDKKATSELEELSAQVKVEELNKKQVRRWLSECDSGNFSIVNELIIEDLKVYYASDTFGREWLRASVEAFPRSLSESIHCINELFADEDKVVAYMTVKGTHTGVFMGVPPSGKKIKFDAFTVYRLENGMIKEIWMDENAVLKLMLELGISF